MKNEELRIKNEKDPLAKPRSDTPHKPEQGAESQLHNYNVALTRLGDLFGHDDEEAPPAKSER